MPGEVPTLTPAGRAAHEHPQWTPNPPERKTEPSNLPTGNNERANTMGLNMTTTYTLGTPFTLKDLRLFCDATVELPEDVAVRVAHDPGATGAGAQFDPPRTTLSVTRPR